MSKKSKPSATPSIQEWNWNNGFRNSKKSFNWKPWKLIFGNSWLTRQARSLRSILKKVWRSGDEKMRVQYHGKLASRIEFLYLCTIDHDYLKKLDRSIVTITTLGEEDSRAETRFWLSKPPVERLIALELLRMRMHGYDNTQSRFQRFYTVTERP